MIDFTTDLIGQTIFAEPTGNNARRDNNLKKFKLISIKRKYVELENEFGRVELYDKVRGFTQSAQKAGLGLNAGFRFYLTEKEYQIEIEKRNQISEITKDMGFGSIMVEYGTPEEVKTVYDIIMKMRDRRDEYQALQR